MRSACTTPADASVKMVANTIFITVLLLLGRGDGLIPFQSDNRNRPRKDDTTAGRTKIYNAAVRVSFRKLLTGLEVPP